MKIFLGGLRGSWPIADLNCLKYGGETTCLLVEGHQGEYIVVDFGSGARRISRRLKKKNVFEVLCLSTHYHLDHIIGLPAFSLLYDPRSNLEFAAPPRKHHSIHDVLPRLLEQPFWPLQITMMKSDIRFTTLPGSVSQEPRLYKGMEIRWMPVHHTEGCTAYRLDERGNGASVIVATDIEWALTEKSEQERFLAFCQTPNPATCLIFDGHFTPEEYEWHQNWGHSTWLEGVRIAQKTGIKQLIVTHHSQYHTDNDLEEIRNDIEKEMHNATIGKEGSLWDLDGPTGPKLII